MTQGYLRHLRIAHVSAYELWKSQEIAPGREMAACSRWTLCRKYGIICGETNLRGL